MILLDFLNTFLPSLAIAAAMWIVLRVFRVNAATRYAAWWAVLAAVVALPLWPFHEAEPVLIAVLAPTAPLEVPPSTDWFAWIALAWGSFAANRLARIVLSYLHLRRVRHTAEPVGLDRFESLQSSVRRKARLLVSRDITSPMAVGFLRPVVILPESLLDCLKPAELDHVLLHELAHISRWDDWTNLVARLAGAVLGLHPVAAFALARIAKERELACDDWVVAATGEARSYAASLARVFELSRGGKELLATGMTGSQLGDRVEHLLAAGRRFTRGASLATLLMIAAALVGMVIAGAQSPQWVAFAQERAVPPAPPAPPAAPVPPVAPRPPAPPARPVVPATDRTQLRKVQDEIRAQEEAIRGQEEAIHAQEASIQIRKAELTARQAELERLRSQVQPPLEQVQSQIERLWKQIQELEAQQKR